ncbi:uncharacterized protein LOC129743267 [Uranotaenia lowii]|uniref:uncharacterized protein LOC129743267 n=1 Tax=Uranotaenia lowii TaxID=190385 RepID=UPI00247A37BD|nr:uncharacterized protein LOC129743267 [Uranotaenia lowii]
MWYFTAAYHLYRTETKTLKICCVHKTSTALDEAQRTKRLESAPRGFTNPLDKPPNSHNGFRSNLRRSDQLFEMPPPANGLYGIEPVGLYIAEMPPGVIVCFLFIGVAEQVLLATAVVVLEDDFGNQYPARALLDSGSESNLLTERMSQRLKTTRERVEICVIGIGQAATKVKQRIHATVRSRVSEFLRAISFLVLPKVTVNLPTTTVQTKGWRFPDGIQLADPSFSVSSEVDIVLGIESFFDFFHTGEKIDLGDQLPSLNHSVFGWVVCEGLPTPRQAIQVISNTSITEDPLEAMVARFWFCEKVESTNFLSTEEARCESLFSKTVKRESDGRYTVSLPRNEDIIDRLGELQEIAMRRFLATERRLSRDENLRKQYEQFMEEYVHLGHMQKIVELKDESCQKSVVKRCLLPHHPVVKEASTTTKVRVVFDASCKTSSGVSLNDGLLNGPVIQDDLCSIILRCRTKQVMVVADIEKMFWQINIAEDDRPLRSILWRSSPKAELSIYELRTVTYGTKPAPFLATRTLQHLATDEKEFFHLQQGLF